MTPSDSPTKPPAIKKPPVIAYALVVVIILMLGGIAAGAMTWTQKNRTIDSQVASLASLRSQLANQNNTIASLNGQITDLQKTISNLQAQDSADQATITTLRSQVADLDLRVKALQRANIIATFVWHSPCEGFCILGVYDYIVDWAAYANTGTNTAYGAILHVTFYSGAGESGSILCRQDIVLGSGGLVAGQFMWAVGSIYSNLPSCGSGNTQAASTGYSVTWT